jgi:mannosyltransferase OCH1-like enzyme
MARKLNKYYFAEDALIYHDHPINKDFKGEIDDGYKLAYDEERRQHDNKLFHERQNLLGFEFVDRFKKKLHIPKRILTIWLNANKITSKIQSRIDTHKLDGFEHKVITLDNCYRGSKYVRDCLARCDEIGWVKAADYLRLYYLYEEGGIYLDIDSKVLKPFGLELLSSRLFACREDNGFIANGIIGVEPHHPVVKACLDKMEAFNGSDDKVFEYGMNIWTVELDNFGVFRQPPNENGTLTPIEDPTLYRIYPQEYFLPYNHQTGKTNITANSYTFHEYDKSWLK